MDSSSFEELFEVRRFLALRGSLETEKDNELNQEVFTCVVRDIAHAQAQHAVGSCRKFIPVGTFSLSGFLFAGLGMGNVPNLSLIHI